MGDLIHGVMERLHRITGAICVGLLVVVVVGQLAVVILRYVWGVGFVELQQAVAWGFAALVVLALPVALRDDGHVRVDVFRERQGPRARAVTDLAATLALLVPVFGATLWLVWPDIVFAWSIREGSHETGGLPGYFLVKSVLPLACMLMLAQGLAGLWRRNG